MITLSPLKDKQEIKDIFNRKNIPFDEFSGCLTAVCGGEILGLSLYSLDSKKMTVHYIEPLNDIALADGILRSTLHIAAENGIMSAFFSDTLSEDFLSKVRFIKNIEEKSLEIEKLFRSCKDCK